MSGGGGRDLAEFVAEAGEVLEALGRDLLALDEARDAGEEPDPERLNGVFRAAHTLKGLSGLFGQERMAHLAHAMEDVLDRLRLGRLAAGGEVLDALVEALDVLQAQLVEVTRGPSSFVDARGEAAAARLSRLALAEARRPADDPLERVALEPGVRAVLTEYEEHRLREAVRRGLGLWRVRAAFDLSDFDQGLARLNALLKAQGEVISTLPAAVPESGERIAFDLLVGSRASHDALAAALLGTPAALAPVEVREPAPAPPLRALSAEPAPEAPPAAPALVPATQTVRVDIRRLDGLMNTVGELLLIRANVARLAETARTAEDAHTRALGQELVREARLLERQLDVLQRGLLEARMVPLGQVFDKLGRLVRRVAREAGKELDLVARGAEVELDKLIVEELSDPLMHILRNAIDHGAEGPEARLRAGKPRRAQVALAAVQQGNTVVLTVADDGAGIDEARVREVALARGLASRERLAEMGRREVLNLIFVPGFSTAPAVSTLSGRGVGLDVVKNNIGHLSGIIDVASEPGRGTTFTLTLPVTLAIVRALVVGTSGRTYALPLNSVLEILSVRPDEVRTVEGREVLDLRGQTLPFTRLSRLFALPERPAARHFVVVVGLAQQRLGLAVDALHGQQDIVTKPLGSRLAGVRGVSGATDLGDRRAVLVLDVAALMEDGTRAPSGHGRGARVAPLRG